MIDSDAISGSRVRKGDACVTLVGYAGNGDWHCMWDDGGCTIENEKDLEPL